MTDWGRLERFLALDPADAGCDRAMDLLHVYAELAAADPAAAAHRYPEVAAHLRACPPCGDDLDALLAQLRVDAAPTASAENPSQIHE
jgi:hypothetical protein